MKTYYIGEIEKITGVKTNVLRYWEATIPGFSPEKDLSGRRVYTQSDLELVLRLKYLIYEKKFTIEGARNQLLEDADSSNEKYSLINQIHELRNELMELYKIVKRKES